MRIHSILFFGCQKTSCSRNASTISTEVNTCGPHKVNFQFHNSSVATKKPWNNKKTHGKKTTTSIFSCFLFFSIKNHHQAQKNPSTKNGKISLGNSKPPFFFCLVLWFALRQKNHKDNHPAVFVVVVFSQGKFRSFKARAPRTWTPKTDVRFSPPPSRGLI